MIPIRTAASNFVYRGSTPDIGDAWVRRAPGERAVYLVWQPSKEERAYIAAGGNIELGIFGMEPIPPVSLNTTDEEPLSAAGAAMRDQARAVLQRDHGGQRAGRHPGRPLARQQRRLAAAPGRARAWGRPLVEVEGADEDTIEYAVAVPG